MFGNTRVIDLYCPFDPSHVDQWMKPPRKSMEIFNLSDNDLTLLAHVVLANDANAPKQAIESGLWLMNYFKDQIVKMEEKLNDIR